MWFQKRTGILQALLRKEPTYIRAVDGLDLDIRKGEVFCLVGESGCGKTTTGKGILRLVEPTGGDVFLEPPVDILSRYAELSASNRDASTDREFHELRGRHSLSYTPVVRATRREVAVVLGAALAAAVAAVLVAVPFSAAHILWGWFPVGHVVPGVAVGFLGTRPPVRLLRRLPAILAALSILTVFLADLLGASLSLGSAGLRPDIESISGRYGGLWQTETGLLLLGYGFAVLGALAGGSWFKRRREASEGFEADKIRKLRRKLQIIFQDPYESLNPKHSVLDIVAEPLKVNRYTRNPRELEERVVRALRDAGLRPPEEFLFRFPHELSGGQRQRVSIAAALVLEPEFIVADEPVSMLDVSIRTEILDLLLELRRTRGLTYLFITHDLSLAWVVSDRIAVMYLGKIVEMGPTRDLVRSPRHPYTRALISVVPVPDPTKRRERIILKGERPDPSDIPTGCRFHPRCPLAFEKCGWNAKELAEELTQVLASGGLSQVASVEPLGMTALRVVPREGTTPGELADTLRSVFSAQREKRLPFKGANAVEVHGADVVVTMQEWAEPQLLSTGPDYAVACHLAVPA